MSPEELNEAAACAGKMAKKMTDSISVWGTVAGEATAADEDVD